MVNIRKAGLAAAGTALAFGSLLASAPANAAPADTSDIGIMATCGKTYDIYVGPRGARRGESHYSISCSGSGSSKKSTAAGWLKDTRADGKCIQVKVVWPGDGTTKFSKKACPEDEVEYFDFTGTGTIEVYTMTV
jgi:hypothetical protein